MRNTRIILIGMMFIAMSSLSTNLLGATLSVTGQTLDRSSGTPLQNVLISVMDRDGAKLRTAISDSEGNFAFTLETEEPILKDTLSMKVESIGYEARTFFYNPDLSNLSDFSLNGESSTFGDGKIVIRLEKLKTLQTHVVRRGNRLSDRERKSITTTTLTEEDIESIKIRDSKDLTAISANLFSLNSESAFGSFFSLRGIASINTYDPLIVFYIDDIAQFQSQNVPLHFANIESIRILKGPQLTLYGRNAMAGVIDIQTKKPDKPFAVTVSAEGQVPFQYSSPVNENLGTFLPPEGTFNLFFSTPLGYEDSFLRSQTTVNYTDGIFTNVNTNWNKNTGGEFSWDTSLELLFPLSPSVALTLIGKYNNSETEIYPYASSIEEAFANPYEVDHNVDSVGSRVTGEGVLKFDVNLPYFNFVSTSTYQNFKNKLIFDGDFSPQELAEININFAQQVFTEEFRFTSTSLTEKYFSWLLGFYFYFKDQQYDTEFNTGTSGTVLDSQTTIDGSEVSTGTAIFGSLTFPFWQDRMALVIGNRVDIETRNHVNTNIETNIANSTTVTNSAADENYLQSYYTVKGALTTSIFPTLDHFFSVSTGFRSGGVNLFTTDPERILYGREYSTHVETGLRGNFRPITFNFSLFYIHWQDQQITLAFTGGSSIFEFGILNVDGNSDNYGVEYEMDLRLPYGFGIDTTLGYTESQYAIYTPQFTINGGLKHFYQVKEGFFRHLNRIEYRYLTDVFFELSHDPALKQDAYGLLNFSSSFYFGKSFLVNFWIKNMLDKRYISFVLPFGNISGPGTDNLQAAKLGDPFTLGLKLAYTF